MNHSLERPQPPKSNTRVGDDRRWAAVAASDRGFDGKFYYSVKTTGVYCLPSCPARPAKRANVEFHQTRAEAEAAGFRPCKRCKPDQPAGGTPRVAAIDWQRVGEELDGQGFAIIPGLLSAKEARALAGLYADDSLFRSRVVMARHGFGRGEYKYFAYPLPGLIATLRAEIYPHLAPVANRWHEAMKLAARFPAEHEDFLKRCRAAGQARPTPLLLQYGPGDFNCLHQDLYGEQVFPLQVTILLSEPGEDFTGGEFILTEQRPRMQSKATVVPLGRGDGVIFAVNQRPARGAKGVYRVKPRHGVSLVRSGRRRAAGIIFHEAR